MDGVYLIDKPSGMVSFELVQLLRKTLEESKVGYLGTLDPLASGLMVFFVGKATKLIPACEELTKEYLVEMEFGSLSDTYDRTGQISTTGKSLTSSEDLLEALKDFRGPIWQIQPRFSAIRRGGRRAYDMARAGEDFDLGKRQVIIHELELIEYKKNFCILKVVCSSGTYVRSLVHELGEKLGCGAVMTELRRTRIGTFDVSGAQSLSTLTIPKKLSGKTLRDSGIDWKHMPLSCQSLFNDQA